MSREDPQLRIRLPIELKEKVEVTAKENGRSMNAEIVQRLESSFLGDINTDDVIAAKDAIIIANKAKDELSSIIFKRTFKVINNKIRLGHSIFNIELEDLDLEGLGDDFISVLEPTISKLTELGYQIPESVMDVDGFLVEIPSSK
ncbi:Arc family DNA-binding protein [Proteus mirabilis]|uniref:Arc family DNA-binding protein n=1 Tax=Proteus TaxID=583 RepID=UPI000D6E2431|nr:MULTISPECIES: Arc family DNA-binding protein [Proteus]NBM11702.1 Arc family DNA-binding protein [Proteus sp. G2670]NBM32214.1 Arc family DNA-binding protein [Proteus sp. G2664]QPT33507.1 Arc family DNA-binding protein [Proteus penneri]UXA35815.1 Arc family DNA-binding protein [Proteus terrae]